MVDFHEYRWIEETVQSALDAAFTEQEADIHREYPIEIPGGARRRVDFVIEHRDWGLFVIEVKLLRRSLGLLYDAFNQARSYLWDIFDQRGRPTSLTARALVFAPDMNRAEWETSSWYVPELGPFIVFADELEPAVLRRKLKEAPPIPAGDLEVRPSKAPPKEHDIFISYRRADAAWAAGRLADRLRSEFGTENVFLDVQSIGLGQEFTQVIRQRIERSSVLLVIIGPTWLTQRRSDSGIRRIDEPDDFVRWEIAMALDQNLTVIPILIDETLMPRPEHLPEPIQQLAMKNAARLASGHFHADVQTLVTELKKILGKSEGDA